MIGNLVVHQIEIADEPRETLKLSDNKSDQFQAEFSISDSDGLECLSMDPGWFYDSLRCI